MSDAELINARFDVIERRLARLERRWAPADQHHLEQALASLGRAVARESVKA